MASYEYRHVVGFEETSLIGNVYFSHYLEWQGQCRERFLHDHALAVIEPLRRGEIAFFTRSCSCDYSGGYGYSALDEVLIRMELLHLRGGRMKLGFTYLDGRDERCIVATGEQEVACMARRDHGWQPAPFPVPLLLALHRYAEDPTLTSALDDALAFQGATPDGEAPPPSAIPRVEPAERT